MGLTCIGCERFTFEKVGGDPTRMARLGMGRCALDKRTYVHYSAMFVRECDKFKPRDAALTTRFIAWLQAQGNNTK